MDKYSLAVCIEKIDAFCQIFLSFHEVESIDRQVKSIENMV